MYETKSQYVLNRCPNKLAIHSIYVFLLFCFNVSINIHFSPPKSGSRHKDCCMVEIFIVFIRAFQSRTLHSIVVINAWTVPLDPLLSPSSIEWIRISPQTFFLFFLQFPIILFRLIVTWQKKWNHVCWNSKNNYLEQFNSRFEECTLFSQYIWGLRKKFLTLNVIANFFLS